MTGFTIEATTTDGFVGDVVIGPSTREQAEAYVANWRDDIVGAELTLIGPGGVDRVAQVEDIADVRVVER